MWGASYSLLGSLGFDSIRKHYRESFNHNCKSYKPFYSTA